MPSGNDRKILKDAINILAFLGHAFHNLYVFHHEQIKLTCYGQFLSQTFLRYALSMTAHTPMAMASMAT